MRLPAMCLLLRRRDWLLGCGVVDSFYVGQRAWCVSTLVIMQRACIVTHGVCSFPEQIARLMYESVELYG